MRKKSVLIALVILALGLVGIGLSTLHKQNEYLQDLTTRTFKVSYGFPLGWHGYSVIEGRTEFWGTPPHEVVWFSLESFLLDAAFWVAISFLVCIAIMKSVSILHKARTSKNLSAINI